MGESEGGEEWFIVGPATLDEIIARLEAKGLVRNRRLAKDVLGAILDAFVEQGLAEVREEEIETPGFYLIDGKLVVAKWEAGQLDVEKLREALTLLNELGEKWFKHVEAKFATVMKWGAAAPFSFILKEKGAVQKHLYLYGCPGTGVTTLGKIVLKLWGLGDEYEKTGLGISTVARLGRVLNHGSFPILIDEPQDALMEWNVVEMLANSSKARQVRVKYLSLTPLLFTSNKFLPYYEDVLRPALIFVTFRYRERIPKDKQEEFTRSVMPRLPILREIGACIGRMVIENPSLLNEDDVLKLGEKLLAKCYEVAGMEKPTWLSLIYESEGRLEEVIAEELAERLKQMVNNLYAKYYAKMREEGAVPSFMPQPDSIDEETKLEILLERFTIPGIWPKRDDTVLILDTLLGELGLEDRFTLKSFEKLFGFARKTIRMGREVERALEAPLWKLKHLLTYGWVD